MAEFHPEPLETFICDLCQDLSDRARTGTLKLIVPNPKDCLYRSEGMQHFHLHHELFYQISGCSVMQTLVGDLPIHEGECFLICRGFAHWEKCKPTRKPFHNVVTCFHGETLTLHHAIANGNNHPRILDSMRRLGSRPGYLQHYLDDLVYLHLEQKGAKTSVIQALFHVFAEGLLELLRTGRQPDYIDNHKVRLCQRLVMEHLALPELSVKWLAERLQCTADYLSHVFKTSTRHSLIDYIHINRIDQAKKLLMETSLNIGEVGRACGYRDAAYFSRVFQQYAERSPRQFRKSSN